MATTSYLYHSMGLRGYTLISTEYINGWNYFHIELKKDKRHCANCWARWHELAMDGQFERTFFAVPCGIRPQFVVLHGHRQACKRCGKSWREPIQFTKGQRRHLKSFARYVVDLCRLIPIKQVADLLGVGWDMVKEIHKEYLQTQWKTKNLKDVRYVAVDEFALEKGHRYMSIVMDLENGEILHAEQGKDAKAIAPFLEKLKATGNLKAVAMDMSIPFRSAFYATFAGTKVDLVHDPYHVVALVNKAIDETRRNLAGGKESDTRRFIKGSRFILLRGLESLSEKGMERLIQLMNVNEPLYKAYLLKEDLRTFWSLDERAAPGFLDHWIEQAQALGINQFKKLAQTLDRHREGLLSYFRHRVSTGPLEGTNNKIKVLKRQAYGFRGHEYFKLILYHLHQARPRVSFG